MWEKLSQNRFLLSFLIALTVFLPSPVIEIWPLIFLMPVLLNLLIIRCPTFGSALGFGWLTSFFVSALIVHWVIYVVHEFGYLPWSISFILYLLFCGIGALNFPAFTMLAHWIHRRFKVMQKSQLVMTWWLCLGLPALFTVIEFLVPKLFPWTIGLAFYRVSYLTQILEITGTSALTFCIYSLGGLLGVFLLRKRQWKMPKGPMAFVAILWLFVIGFGIVRIENPPDPNEYRTLRVALIQPNIGTLEKVQAIRGIENKVQYVLDRYKKLTETALRKQPDLILWPETALPFQIVSESEFAKEVKSWVVKWQIPLITGAYAPAMDLISDYNAAYLLEPRNDQINFQVYYKNVLLAFGEYMPFGEIFPSLYRYFPQVSRFERGTTQNIFVLHGLRLGVSVCYEAIVHEFVLKVAKQGVQGLVNLTNDSWFGKTLEPYQHAALTSFRAIELRAPVIRVTNTGTSFTVDDRGRMSEKTKVYDQDTLIKEVPFPLTPRNTLYVRFGNWFIGLCAVIVLSMVGFFYLKKKHVSLPL